MEKISLKVDGMVCSGCENRVKNALKNIDGVTKVNASFKNGMVTITLKKEIDKNLLEQEIENLGYKIMKEV